MSGYIYAIECGDRVKIGFSKHPEKRFAKVASDAPFPCTLLGYWPGDIADELEVHAKFHAIRSHGEWFAVTTDLLDFIGRHAITRQAHKRRFAITESDGALARWRKKKGMSQGEVAALVGVDTSMVSRWEAGKVIPRPMAIRVIASVTEGEVTADDLVGTT